jgi:flagellar L-ring protein precursor FlgH
MIAATVLWRSGVALVLGLALDGAAGAGRAADLYNPSNFSAMAADRRAERVGDSLIIVINQNTTASNSNKASAAKSNGFAGHFGLGASTSQGLQLGGSSSFDGSGQTSHAGKIVAQISVVVQEVLPNGDLRVAGDQALDINGERTRIKLTGRVRLADISSANSAPSSSLADAVIDYDGKGFVASSAKPGVVTRIFAWLGLI